MLSLRASECYHGAAILIHDSTNFNERLPRLDYKSQIDGSQ